MNLLALLRVRELALSMEPDGILIIKIQTAFYGRHSFECQFPGSKYKKRIVCLCKGVRDASRGCDSHLYRRHDSGEVGRKSFAGLAGQARPGTARQNIICTRCQTVR